MTIADNKESTYSTLRKNTFMRQIISDMRKTLRGEPHTMAEVRQSLNSDLRKQIPFIEVLTEHHNYLKESIVVCLDKDSSEADRQFHLDRLLQLFEMHAKAEEQTLYKMLIASPEKEARIEGNLGQDEHDLIYQVMDELRDMHYKSLWTEDVEAKVLVLSELIANHLKKEEQEIFPIAKEDISSGQLNNLAVEYLNLCDNYLGMSEIRAKGIFL